jgi:hypothetical protein
VLHQDHVRLPGACEDEDALEEKLLRPGFSIDDLHGLLDTEAPAASASQEGAHAPGAEAHVNFHGGEAVGQVGPGQVRQLTSRESDVYDFA